MALFASFTVRGATRLRAKRPVGQLMAAQAAAVGKAKGGDVGGRGPSMGASCHVDKAERPDA